MSEEEENGKNVGMSPDAFGALVMSAAGSRNGKPDTAQGIAETLKSVEEFVEGKGRVEFSAVLAEDGTPMPIISDPEGGYERIKPEAFDDYRSNPQFRRGCAKMTSLDSFIAHVNRFGDSDSAVFANDDRSSPSLTAVLDYHRADTLVAAGDKDSDEIESDSRHGEYRHGKHRTLFNFPLSDEWKEWADSDGKPMKMAQFALFLENQMGDIALLEDGVPESAERFVETNGGKKMIADYATLIELARGLRVNESSAVEEAVNLASGEGKIRMSSEHTDTKVGSQTIKVPTMFFIAIQVFRNGDYYRLPVRLRYRKTAEGLVFWYDLWRADRAFETAFREDVEKVDEQTQAQVFYGSPE